MRAKAVKFSQLDCPKAHYYASVTVTVGRAFRSPVGIHLSDWHWKWSINIDMSGFELLAMMSEEFYVRKRTYLPNHTQKCSVSPQELSKSKPISSIGRRTQPVHKPSLDLVSFVLVTSSVSSPSVLSAILSWRNGLTIH